jgi:hypothetical protein
MIFLRFRNMDEHPDRRVYIKKEDISAVRYRRYYPTTAEGEAAEPVRCLCVSTMAGDDHFIQEDMGQFWEIYHESY